MSALPFPVNRVLHGDCVQLMRDLPDNSIDLVLTDPPYLVNYRDRIGREVANDNNPDWLEPAYAEMYRVMKPRRICVTFCGWTELDLFASAWRKAGFTVVGQLIFHKRYASSKHVISHRHEQAYVLAKGKPRRSEFLMESVQPFSYTGNALHPTQKPLGAMFELVTAFSREGEIVLDPFSGSGTTLVAAKAGNRRFIGCELDAGHCMTAGLRIHGG